jgi:hypothetical protein
MSQQKSSIGNSQNNNSNGGAGTGCSNTGLAGYHMQQSLGISSQLTKAVFDQVKKGDVEGVKTEQAKIGINIKFLMDE